MLAVKIEKKNHLNFEKPLFFFMIIIIHLRMRKKFIGKVRLNHLKLTEPLFVAL